MTLLDNVRGWFRTIQAAPTERKVADMVGTRSDVTDDHFPERVDGKRFEPGTCYFGIRLSGLHLVDARKFAERRLPLCVCLAEFQYDGRRRTVPFSIGPDEIRRKLSDAGRKSAGSAASAWIELRDLTVVRPTPVNEGNVSLYAGLFSMPEGDLVKTLLNLVGTVGTALGQPAVGGGLKVAESVYNGFGALLGLGEVEQVTAALIGSALTEAGSGYLLIANVAPGVFDPKSGRVVSGRLHWPVSKGGGEVVEFDHALLALDHYDTILEKGTGLAPLLFQSQWSAVLKASRSQANAALVRLQDAIAASPDVTETDRIALISSYALAFEQLAKARWRTNAPEDEQRGTRGSALPQVADRLRDAELALPKDASGVRRAVGSIVEAVSAQSRRWESVAAAKPFLAAKELDCDEGVLDDAIVEAALAVRKALAKGGEPARETSRGVATIVGRAVQV